MMADLPPSARKTEPACALRNVGKSIGGIFACRHIELEILTAKVIGLTGENFASVLIAAPRTPTCAMYSRIAPVTDGVAVTNAMVHGPISSLRA